MTDLRTEALLLEQDLTLSLGIRELPSPDTGQALLRVDWAGVCGSDLHVMRTGDWVRYWPSTLGHEIVGTVQSCPGGELNTGARVVIDSRVACGRCTGCETAPNRCERLMWVGEAQPGGFASKCVLPVSNLMPCPETLESAIAVLAEPLAVALHALNRVGHVPTRMLVLGYGPLGALIHLAAQQRWPETTIEVVEPMPARRQLAAALGARATEPGQSQRAELVIDAAGYPGSLSDAISLSENGGSVAVVALGHTPVQTDPVEVAEREVSVVGVNGFDQELSTAAANLSEDPDRYRPVITEALLLQEAAERLPSLQDVPSVGKVVITPWTN